MATHVSGGITSNDLCPAIFIKEACPNSRPDSGKGRWQRKKRKYQPGGLTVRSMARLISGTFLKFAALCEAFFYSACVL
jgi:hypothetical protein